MAEHALISPSKASRLLSCTASWDAEERYPSLSSKYAEEGTEAHSLLEQCLRRRIHPLSLAPDHPAAAAVAVAYDTVETETVSGKAIVFSELRVKLTDDCWGTADIVIYDFVTNELTVLDYKHGQGVPVNLPSVQLDIYAAAAIKTLGDLIGRVDIVVTGVIQPRCPHEDGPVRMLERSLEDLDAIVKAVEALESRISSGKTTYTPSENNCRWCPATGKCRAQSDAAFEAMKAVWEDSGTLVLPTELTKDERISIYKQGGFITGFLSSIAEQLMQEALSGQEIPGFKLVEGRSIRKWSKPEEEVLDFLVNELNIAKKDAAPPSLLSPTKIEEQLKKLKRGGKDKLEKLAAIVERPTGKPTLVPESDKRTAITVLTKIEGDTSCLS